MNIEIERKYLIKKPDWIHSQFLSIEDVVQAYLCSDPQHSVRIRIKGDKAFITIKGETQGFSRSEFEYEIPLKDAQSILETMDLPVVKKKRYKLEFSGNVWEIDVFKELNAPLMVAEIELRSEQERFDLPDWVGEEVTHDERYYNLYLAKNPYSKW